MWKNIEKSLLINLLHLNTKVFKCNNINKLASNSELDFWN